MRRLAPPPELELAGAIFWLVGLATIGLVAEILVTRLPVIHGEAPPPVVSFAPAITALAASALCLIMLWWLIRHWPRVGYAAFAAIGMSILLGCLLAVVTVGLQLLPFFVIWPGWAPVGFINAAVRGWRASKEAGTETAGTEA